MPFNKLLLVRAHGPNKDKNSTLVQRANVTAFLQGDPINISPLRWAPEDGISHYGYVLHEMRIGELEALNGFAKAEHDNGVTVQDYDPEAGVDKALAAVGLKIYEDA